MKVAKLVQRSLLIVVALVVALVVGLYLLQEAIPGPGIDTIANSRVYDESYSKPVGQVSENLDGYRASLVSPSLSVAVAISGQLVWADARGYADIESQTLATPDTVYAIGSVSKPITAALAALLWEKGLLDIDSDIRDYVPDFPVKRYPITMRQLLSHQAGIRGYKFSLAPPLFSESALNREFSTTAESLSLFADDALLFEPDSNFNYSTFGYTLVSAVIEQASGQSFIAALEDYVLAPLAMTRTSLDKAGSNSGVRATDYAGTFSKKAVIKAPATNSSYKWAGGGLVSTPTDLVKFGSALLENRLLSAATAKTVFTARSLRGGELNPQHYGFGWRIGGLVMTDEQTGDEKIITLLHHGGTRSGSTAILLIVPDYALVVAMTSNTVGRGGSDPLTSVAAKVARTFIRFESDRGRGPNP